MARGKSLYSSDKECWLCQSPTVHLHHIYGGHGRRSVSDEQGCWVYLCPAHHNMSNAGVHFDKELERFFHEDCQRRWEERNGLHEPEHESFRRLFGRSYL